LVGGAGGITTLSPRPPNTHSTERKLTMKKLIEKIENETCTRYGFEAKRTVATFKVTEVIRKALGIEY
jgi:hypothetical protein